jgi:hypothetical protein
MAANQPSWSVEIAGQPLGAAGAALFPRSLRCEIGMDGVGRCTLDLIVPPGAALPVPGAALTVALGLGEDPTPVFTGEIDSVRATSNGAIVSAGDALARLANSFGAGTYSEQSPGQILGDLLAQAELSAGTLDELPALASYVLFPGLSLLHHARVLADTFGASLFADAAGKVHLLAPDTTGDTHSFSYGRDILDLDLCHAPATRSGVDVWGEGAASTQGSDKAHWLPDELEGVKGDADLSGDPVFASPAALRRVLVRDGALRTGDIAGKAATGRAAALVRGVRGSLDVAGAATVAPGDIVAITDLPATHPARSLPGLDKLRVRRVRHRLDLQRGFTTRMEF